MLMMSSSPAGASFAAGAVPHGWLLPQCSVGVVHGGAGTVAAVVGAGIPCVVTPVLKNDQHWWGARLSSLGIGVGLNKQLAKTSGADVAAALQKVDASMRERVRATAAAMNTEDGVGRAAALIASMANRAAEAATLSRRPTSLQAVWRTTGSVIALNRLPISC